jgi:hypothetical protein
MQSPFPVMRQARRSAPRDRGPEGARLLQRSIAVGEHDDEFDVSTPVESKGEGDAARIATAIANGLQEIAGAIERGFGEVAAAITSAGTSGRASNKR